MTIRSAVEEIPRDLSIKYLREYYYSSEPFYTGSQFEELEAYNNPHDRITGSDLMAVATLNTPIGRKASMGILITEADRVNALLSPIPNKPLGDLTEQEFGSYLGSRSCAIQLWDALRRHDQPHDRWNVGPTRASKIMARKRPHLIPIRDSVIDEVVGHKSKANDWELWWNALKEDDYLETRASELREALGLPDLSSLRVLDVMLWMHGRSS